MEKNVYLLKKEIGLMQSRKNEDNEDIKRRSRSFDNQNRVSINEWLIISFEWQIPIIIYEWHVKTGSHLKIQATLDQILAEGYIRKYSNWILNLNNKLEKWNWKGIFRKSQSKFRRCFIL